MGIAKFIDQVLDAADMAAESSDMDGGMGIRGRDGRGGRGRMDKAPFLRIESGLLRGVLHSRISGKRDLSICGQGGQGLIRLYQE